MLSEDIVLALRTHMLHSRRLFDPQWVACLLSVTRPDGAACLRMSTCSIFVYCNENDSAACIDSRDHGVAVSC